MMKSVLSSTSTPARHWVGDGFPVHGLFDYRGPGAPQRSPFLLLDYAAPTTFSPSPQHRRGVGQHPHRGFETVTIVYDGAVEHRDSTGQGGVIGPGDVQWMTAGAGILHEEFHATSYAQTGGPFEMVQLWVNLPAKDKMAPPGYQALTSDQIPTDTLAEGAGTVRVIAGQRPGLEGPAKTFTPMNVWDVRLSAGARVDLDQPEGWTTLLVVLEGTVLVNDQVVRGPVAVTLSSAGTGVYVEANGPVKMLVLAGEPINEPIVGHGPFVMNTTAQIAQAFADFSRGTFGELSDSVFAPSP